MANKAIPTGTGFLIWKLKNFYLVDVAIEALQRAKADWVCLKLAGGVGKYNQVNKYGKYIGNDSYLKTFIQALKDAGFSVGGWHYLYCSESPGAQAGTAGERYQKFDLDFWMIDAEETGGAGWKTDPDRYRNAEVYMNQIRGAGIPQKAPVGFCSYRFPIWHSEIPWTKFLRHESCNMINVQMYWAGAHNPKEQLIKCFDEYDDIVEGKPHIPIGAAYREHGWEPTVGDIEEFILACKSAGLLGYGFYSLDVAKDRRDWLDAIGGHATHPEPPSDPEPDPDPDVPPECVEVANCQRLNIRTAPQIVDRTKIGSVPNGTRFKVAGKEGEWYQVVGYAHSKYMKGVI